jgi:hypothetical protein
MPHVSYDLSHAFMRDDLAFEHYFFTLGASLGVLLTYPLMYHRYFMFYRFISRVCKR